MRAFVWQREQTALPPSHAKKFSYSNHTREMRLENAKNFSYSKELTSYS
jgi:hypothetical protein